ncbi:MAG: hypothetical protein ACR2IL_04515 [Chitinophagaceae bacterium]
MSWRAELMKHRGALRIAVYFEKNPEFIRRIKLLSDARWSVTQQVWHLPDTDENRERFKLPLSVGVLTDRNNSIPMKVGKEIKFIVTRFIKLSTAPSILFR